MATASELTAWMQMLALDGPARAWEPKRLRLRLFSAAGRLHGGGQTIVLVTHDAGVAAAAGRVVRMRDG